jgi:hypothetical protein
MPKLGMDIDRCARRQESASNLIIGVFHLSNCAFHQQTNTQRCANSDATLSVATVTALPDSAIARWARALFESATDERCHLSFGVWGVFS